MKTILKLIVLAVLAFLGTAYSSTANAQEKVTLKIQSITQQKGHIRLAIFDSAALFQKKPCFTTSSAVDDKEMQVEVDLSKGEYAIMLYHDVNNNKKLDLGTYGIPIEPYAVSGCSKGLTGVPVFETCKFKVDGPTTQILPLVLAGK